MAETTDAAYAWRTVPECDLRVEHARLRQPISLIIDDPTPGYNPAYFHLGFRHGPMHTPTTLVDRFADLIEASGIRGKFSVIPYPFGLGRVDRVVEGVSKADVAHFLDVVRNRIAPRMNITPEALTHWNALDLATGQLLPFWENVWSRRQTRDTFLPHMMLGLEILNNVDLPCTGFTCPWNYGDEVEEELAESILAAQKATYGRSIAWYFLHMRDEAALVPPRLAVFRPKSAEAVVSIETCDQHDFGMRLWVGGEADLDFLLEADGQGGRLAEVLRAGGPVVFHSHWQTMFAQGTMRGVDALAEVARRVKEHFGPRILWTSCDELAHYAAAAASLTGKRSQLEGGGVTVKLNSPFSARNFTVSLGGVGSVSRVLLDKAPLRCVESAASLDEGTYLCEGERTVLCLSLGERHSITFS